MRGGITTSQRMVVQYIMDYGTITIPATNIYITHGKELPFSVAPKQYIATVFDVKGSIQRAESETFALN